MDKEDMVHIYNGILLSHKNEWNNAICSNMDGPRDYHTEWCKSDQERQISYDIIYMWNLIKMTQKKLFIKQEKKTHRFQNQTYGCNKVKLLWGGRNWESGNNTYTWPYKIDD